MIIRRLRAGGEKKLYLMCCNCFPKREEQKILFIILRRGRGRGGMREGRGRRKLNRTFPPNLQTYIAQFILLPCFQKQFSVYW